MGSLNVGSIGILELLSLANDIGSPYRNIEGNLIEVKFIGKDANSSYIKS